MLSENEGCREGSVHILDTLIEKFAIGVNKDRLFIGGDQMTVKMIRCKCSIAFVFLKVPKGR